MKSAEESATGIRKAARRLLGYIRTPSAKNDMSQVSVLWGRRAAALATQRVPAAWTDSPLVNRMYIHPRFSARPDANWLAAVADSWFPESVSEALSLGCGGGGLERHAMALGIADQFHALDISEEALLLARRLAGDCGYLGRIQYEVSDLNCVELELNRYDAVFASQSLHHISHLEHYLEQVRVALKPGGLFIINEFVGPSQYQWTDQQLELAQEMLDSIPEPYRRSLQGNGVKRRIARPTINEMNRIDPTEAIRSAEIIPEVEKRFEVLQRVDFGGTLLQLVLDDIVGNFQDTASDRRELRKLFDREQALLDSGVLESDFTMMVCR